MRKIFLDRSISYIDVEVDLGDGIFADVKYEIGFTASGEDPLQAFDVDIVDLKSLTVVQVFGPEGHRIPVTAAIETAARRAFYKSRQARLESTLHDRIVEGDYADNFDEL